MKAVRPILAPGSSWVNPDIATAGLAERIRVKAQMAVEAKAARDRSRMEMQEKELDLRIQKYHKQRYMEMVGPSPVSESSSPPATVSGPRLEVAQHGRKPATGQGSKRDSLSRRASSKSQRKLGLPDEGPRSRSRSPRPGERDTKRRTTAVRRPGGNTTAPEFQLPDSSHNDSPEAILWLEKAKRLVKEGKALGQISSPASGPSPSRPEGQAQVGEPEQHSNRQRKYARALDPRVEANPPSGPAPADSMQGGKHFEMVPPPALLGAAAAEAPPAPVEGQEIAAAAPVGIP